MRKFFFISLCLSFASFLFGQDSSNLQFTYSHERVNKDEVKIIITAHIKKEGVILYPIQKTPDDIIYSQVVFDSSANKYLKDSITENATIQQQHDPVLDATVGIIKDSAQWIQNIHLPEGDSTVIKGTITYSIKSGDEFISQDEPFRIEVVDPKKDAADVTATTGGENNDDQKDGETSLIWIFLSAFGGGLLALLTPCVYSMIPVTVSFFTKRSKTREQGIKNALFYSISIVMIFTLLGFLITYMFGPGALNKLATNWIANIAFFLIFVIFGFSFLGAFEIELPSSWSNKADSKASTGSFWGIFFMALTLVIVSFSCTGPIIGNLLVLAARGNYYGPLIGMFGFSLALALPFALFAFFPSKLNFLGKAGGWLNAIKVTLGFLELALALKFLSNADLAKNWRILDREIFIVLWIVIFTLLGLYLLGKLKFKHDDELPKNDFGIPYLSVTRLSFAIASFFMVVYLFPGLFGAPLKGLSAFLPPMGTQDFNADDLPTGFKLEDLSVGSKSSASASGALPDPVKYVEVMKKNEPDVVVNNGMVTYFDYKEGLEVAKKLNKPLMLDFTGINCVNCRLMEGQVWSDPEIMKLLKNEFVIASLYVDVHDGVDIPTAEQYYSKNLNKQITDLGDLNTDLQVSRYNANTQPYYFFLDHDESLLAPHGFPYDPKSDLKARFKKHLENVIAEYKRRHS